MTAWTPERRAAQSQAIHRWKPWERSTGPRTPEGKASSARRGWKGGLRAELRMIARALRFSAQRLADRDDGARRR